MTRRRATILLHWSVLILLLSLLAAGGDSAALSWAFSISGLAMTGLALARGLMNGPGPKLEGRLRMAHPWMQRGLYALLTWAALAVLLSRFGMSAGPAPRGLILALLGAASLHGIFNLWRHTALGDGALRRMTPRIMHGML